MIHHNLYGEAFSKEEAKNQWNEILRLKKAYSLKNPFAANKEVTNWAIESYFMGLSLAPESPFLNEAPIVEQL